MKFQPSLHIGLLFVTVVNGIPVGFLAGRDESSTPHPSSAPAVQSNAVQPSPASPNTVVPVAGVGSTAMSAASVPPSSITPIPPVTTALFSALGSNAPLNSGSEPVASSLGATSSPPLAPLLSTTAAGSSPASSSPAMGVPSSGPAIPTTLAQTKTDITTSPLQSTTKVPDRGTVISLLTPIPQPSSRFTTGISSVSAVPTSSPSSQFSFHHPTLYTTGTDPAPSQVVSSPPISNPSSAFSFHHPTLYTTGSNPPSSQVVSSATSTGPGAITSSEPPLSQWSLPSAAPTTIKPLGQGHQSSGPSGSSAFTVPAAGITLHSASLPAIPPPTLTSAPATATHGAQQGTQQPAPNPSGATGTYISEFSTASGPASAVSTGLQHSASQPAVPPDSVRLTATATTTQKPSSRATDVHSAVSYSSAVVPESTATGNVAGLAPTVFTTNIPTTTTAHPTTLKTSQRPVQNTVIPESGIGANGYQTSAAATIPSVIIKSLTSTMFVPAAIPTSKASAEAPAFSTNIPPASVANAADTTAAASATLTLTTMTTTQTSADQTTTLVISLTSTATVAAKNIPRSTLPPTPPTTTTTMPVPQNSVRPALDPYATTSPSPVTAHAGALPTETVTVTMTTTTTTTTTVISTYTPVPITLTQYVTVMGPQVTKTELITTTVTPAPIVVIPTSSPSPPPPSPPTATAAAAK